MLIATYLPRVLPFFLIDKDKIPKKLFRFLSYIPYAMLGAIIVPGFLQGIPEEPIITIIAFLSGVLICFKWGGTMAPILVTILVATLLQLI